MRILEREKEISEQKPHEVIFFSVIQNILHMHVSFLYKPIKPKLKNTISLIFLILAQESLTWRLTLKISVPTCILQPSRGETFNVLCTITGGIKKISESVIPNDEFVLTSKHAFFPSLNRWGGAVLIKKKNELPSPLSFPWIND